MHVGWCNALETKQDRQCTC